MLLGLRLEVLGFWGFRFWIGRLGGEGWGFLEVVVGECTIRLRFLGAVDSCSGFGG